MVLAARCTLGQVSATVQPAQDAHAPLPAFEVASIRPSIADNDLRNFLISPNRFRVENGTVASLIRFAYNIKSDDQLPKEPRWIGSDKFAIDAKIADAQAEALKSLLPDQKFEQYRLMVRSLLLDRFKLQVKRETKELPVFALVVSKGGPKPTLARVSQDEPPQRMPTLGGGSRGALKGGAVSMALFSEWLSGRDDIGGRVVIDQTGLTGIYDFTLDWTPDETRNAASNEACEGQQDATGASILTAMQEQLGLKLEPERAKVEVLVIDHVERPSEN
jgi:uncharacterized protein (TIGR03435 family)